MTDFTDLTGIAETIRAISAETAGRAMNELCADIFKAISTDGVYIAYITATEYPMAHTIGRTEHGKPELTVLCGSVVELATVATPIIRVLAESNVKHGDFVNHPAEGDMMLVDASPDLVPLAIDYYQTRPVSCLMTCTTLVRLMAEDAPVN